MTDHPDDDWLSAERDRHGPITAADIAAGFSDAVLDAVNDAEKHWPPPRPFDPASVADLPSWRDVSACIDDPPPLSGVPSRLGQSFSSRFACRLLRVPAVITRKLKGLRPRNGDVPPEFP
jgi:hypothetical protein